MLNVNRVDLTARIVEISSMRYSPSGLPVVDVRLEHESQLEEAGVQRKVNLLLKSKAMGILAEKLSLQELNATFHFTGFLASSTNSKSVVFHIHSYQSVS
ncbi:MAG: primosomal replication protein N [Limnohabitans sp.]|nr:primosomal replication protein N [Limnohabitans sp.]